MFDWAIVSPLFGKVAALSDRRGFKSFEFAAIDIASEIADNDVFVLPQGSASFRYSGRPCVERLTLGTCIGFAQRTGVFMDCGIGIDTCIYRGQWRGVAPLCEIVTMKFSGWLRRPRAQASADGCVRLVLF